MPPSLTLDARVIAVPDLLASDLAGDIVLLNLADGVYYGLDLVGAHIWSRITEAKSVQEIVDDVTTHYDVDARRCESDVLAFLADLIAQRLARIVAPGA